MYTIIRYSYGLVIGCLAALTAFAADVQPRRNFTKEGSIRYALTHNSDLLAARSLIEQAEARFAGAGSWEYPELSVAYTSDVAFNDEGESVLEIGFAQRFPITSRLTLLKKIAAVEVELAHAEVANRERLLAHETERVFLGLAEIEAQLALRKQLIQLNEQFAEFIESRIETGEKSQFDLNRLRIELFAEDQEVQQLYSEYALSMGQLKQLMGLELQQPIELEFAFELPAAVPSMPKMDATLLDQHPAFQMKSLLYKITHQRVLLAGANRWEDVVVGVFFEDAASVDEPGGLGEDRFFGISASIPLPVQRTYRYAVEENRAKRRQMQLEMDALSLQLRNRSASLRERVIHLFEQVSIYEQGMRQMVEQNLTDMQTAYSAGQIGLTDLFRSQEQRLKIQSRNIQMLHALEEAYADWKATTAQNIAQPFIK